MGPIDQKGFTLIELLVVIAIIAVISIAVVLTLNPSELLKRARDSTRISDLSTIKTAIGHYLADATSPSIGNTSLCYAHASSSIAGGATGCNGRFAGGTNTTSTSQSITGSGWIPVDLTVISSGAPISAEPLDPMNNATYYYAYRAGAGYSFELNARLESAKYASSSSITDGGNDPNLYEVGTAAGLAL